MGRLTDYGSLLDDEVRAFLARSDSFYPPDAINLSIADQRRVYDDMCRAFNRGYPEGVKTRDEKADGVPVRIYEAGAPNITVVYFHGGGFVVGGLESHDDICAEICALTGFRVVSVDYRLCPEHPHPAAFHDSCKAVMWVRETFATPIVLAGDSAGGNLAAAVAHWARGRMKRIRGQVLIYPGLGGARSGGSYVTHANAPGLTLADLDFYAQVRAGGTPPTDDPTFAPLHDTDFADLPPTVIVSAECDPLCDDGAQYRDAIVDAGGRAHFIPEAGLVHAYLRARGMSVRARESFDRIVTAIQCLGQGVWPYD